MVTERGTVEEIIFTDPARSECAFRNRRRRRTTACSISAPFHPFVAFARKDQVEFRGILAVAREMDPEDLLAFLLVRKIDEEDLVEASG
jgi:hypothetical protein